MPVTLPEGYELVGAALVSTAWLLAGQSQVVSRYRKRSGIKYPQMYAEKAEAAASVDALKFNCAQRAHQNTLENLPVIWITTLVAGVNYPTWAAAACFAWVLSRISYTRGYITGDPKQRVSVLYGLGTAALLSNALAATAASAGWVYAKLKF